MGWPQLRDEIIATAARVSELLRALPDGDLPLSRVSWSASEVGAHLVSLARRYRRMAPTPQPFPASLSADNQRAVAAVSERDPGALADLLEADVAALLETFGDDGEQPTWYFTVEHTISGVGAIMLSELLLHGLDLARASGRSWPDCLTADSVRPRCRPNSGSESAPEGGGERLW